MLSIKTVIRYLLAFVGIFAVLQPLPALLTPPDALTSLIVSGVVAVIALPVAAVFVRRSHSLKRLYGFLLGMYIVVFVALALSALVSIGMSSPVPSGYTVEVVGFQILLLLMAYVVPFVLVYRGGYVRLKSHFI